MRGANINAAATGLMNGIQFMDDRNRQMRNDERQSRMDILNENRENRRAEIDGLTLQQKQAEMQDYQANTPLREQERGAKLQEYSDEANSRDADTLLMGLDTEFSTTGSIDNALRTINNRIDDGLDYMGSTIDKATGRITVKRVDADTGAEYENVYESLDDLKAKARPYMGDRKAWLSNQASRIAQQEKALAAAAAEKKDDKNHKQKLEEINAKGAIDLDQARLNNSSKEAIADAKLLLAQANGKGTVVSEADKRVQTLKMVDIFKEDPAFNYKPDASGKPNRKAPYTPEEKYRMAFKLLYDEDAAAAPAASNPASGGVRAPVQAPAVAPKAPPPRDASMDALWR